MSVEQVGPGSVSNSYGVRTTKSKLVYDNTDSYQDVFIPTGSVPVTATPSGSGLVRTNAPRNAGTSTRSRLLSLTHSVLSAGYTVAVQDQAVAPFEAVQLEYSNYNTAAGYTVSAAGVLAVTADLSLGDTGTPVIATGAPTLAAATGSGNDVIPVYGQTDIIPVRPANSLNLLQVRSYYAGAGSAMNASAGQIAALATLSNRLIASRPQAGDLVGTWGALTAYSRAASTWWAPQSIRYFYSVPSRQLAVAGDSLSRGHLSSSGFHGAGRRVADQLTTSSFVVDLANHAINSQTHAASMKTARNVIQTYQPDAIILSAGSPNTTFVSQALCDAQFADLLQTIDLALQYRVQPILRTCIPWNGQSAPAAALMTALNDRVRALKDRFDIIDSEKAIQDPANPTKILPAYDSGDGLHLNDAGYAAEAAAALAPIKSALGIL